MENKKDNNLFLTFLAGAAAGAVIGILFAPGKGSETRRKITDQTNKLAEDLKDTSYKAMDSINDLRSKIMDIVADLTSGNMGSATFGGLKIKGSWNDIKGKIKQQYAYLTNEDLYYVEGKENELVGRLQKKLGKTKDEVIDLINSFQTERQSQH